MYHIKKNLFPFIVMSIYLIMLKSPNYPTDTNDLNQNDSYTDHFDNNIYTWSKPFSEVLNLLKTKYYQQVNPEDAMVEAINSLARRDPHSAFLEPKSYKDILQNTQGKFYGIGVQIDVLKDPDDEFIRIIDTIPGGPADQIGILPEDKIVQIEDEVVKGLTIEEAVAKIKGPRNTKVHVKIIRTGYTKLLPFDITRDEVKDQNAACFSFSNHNIYYLSLNMFTHNSVKQLEELLKKSQHNNTKGLILDVRNNGGGLLTSVIDIVSLFVPKASLVVTTKDRDNNVIEKYSTTRTPIVNNQIPIFILVNNYTASAAEILAGCLQIYGDSNNVPIFVIGTKTFGKGSVQEVIPISNDCALKLTTALYYLPNDTTIQGIGIIPDLTIEQKYPPSEEIKWLTTYFGHEKSLKDSIKVHAEAPPQGDQKSSKKTWQERKQKQISKDYQIQSSIRLIHLYHLGKECVTQNLKSRKEVVNFLKNIYNPEDIIEMEEIHI